MPTVTITIDTKFYLFNQNNSGGSFHVNDRVCHYVIIEATSASDANRKAMDIGIYFNGVQYDRDCSCCGDRWYSVNDRDAEEEPLIYGQKPEAFDYRPFSSEKGRVQCRIYYIDGVIKEYQ